MPTKAEQKRLSQAVVAFHNHYASIWGTRWDESLYPYLLEPTRYAALINTFAPDEKLHDDLKAEAMPLLPCLQYFEDALLPPRQTLAGLLSHYNLDAASVLAAELLDVQEGHSVLDLCAAPGGKSIAIAQHKPALLHSNELDSARNKRLTTNLRSYLPADFNFKVLKLDGTDKRAAFPNKQYDRVLVDAPCSSERHIVHKHATNPGAVEMMNWKASHSKTLAKTQTELLMTALRLVKPGGRVVYATCSISDIENDGVIERCLQKAPSEIVDDDKLDVMSEKTKYGRIVLPDHKNGGKWGPLFFSVLIKSV
ncbi:putative methyltransferase NSUN3 [Cyphellophora attinorum]|uniref:NOL1/NOP2/Sun domain family member 4 n=1 Tax=Cyphellophora attinorum TaxID=1664694 RepID=A0A0N1HVQ6_9EURO|nr:putative methyltransferase NSUN3 [Phialophora attinorum]KPI43972.1 putative methyltransferase NSUN3 [Phialophora attinorum]